MKLRDLKLADVCVGIGLCNSMDNRLGIITKLQPVLWFDGVMCVAILWQGSTH